MRCRGKLFKRLAVTGVSCAGVARRRCLSHSLVVCLHDSAAKISDVLVLDRLGHDVANVRAVDQVKVGRLLRLGHDGAAKVTNVDGVGHFDV